MVSNEEDAALTEQEEVGSGGQAGIKVKLGEENEDDEDEQRQAGEEGGRTEN